MKYKIVFMFLLMFCAKLGIAHDVESICTADITKVNNGFDVKIKIPTEGLRQVVFSSDPETSFNDYLRKPFDSKVTNPLTEYLVKNFSIEVQNGKFLIPSDFVVEWDEATKFSDHSTIVIKMKYKLEGDNKLQSIVLKNSLLIQEVHTQKNIVNVHVNGKKRSLIFFRGKESQKIEF